MMISKFKVKIKLKVERLPPKALINICLFSHDFWELSFVRNL